MKQKFLSCIGQRSDPGTFPQAIDEKGMPGISNSKYRTKTYNYVQKLFENRMAELAEK